MSIYLCFRISTYHLQGEGMHHTFVSPEIPLIRRVVYRHALRHALFFALKLALRCLKPHAEFSGLGMRYRYRVFLLFYGTYLGSQAEFWDPLFEKIAERPPLRKGCTDTDDKIWSLIIPPGFKALQKIRRFVPKHTGSFQYPLPKLYKNTFD